MDSNYKIRLIKQQKIESSKIKNETNFINSNSPIIKKLRDAEEKYKEEKWSKDIENFEEKELSDDELIELEFKEEAEQIRLKIAQEKIEKETNEIQIKIEEIESRSLIHI